MNFLILTTSIIFGFLIAKSFAGKKEGDQGIIKSIKFKTKNKTIHLHHWLISSIILLFLLLIKYYNDLIFGFLIGLIIQGLTYKDFYKIIYRSKSNN
jgi:hypothetical protein